MNRRLVLVSLFLGTMVLGAILTVPSTLQSQAAPGPNHFKCYSTEGKEVADPAVGLRDQFDPAGAVGKETKVFKAIRFCNPVEKTTDDGVVTPILDPLLHLTLYLTAPTDLAPTRQLTVRNQFGRQRVRTYSPIILGVPTEKNGEGVSPNKDHYKCYSASGRNLNRPVRLRDQFTDANPQPALVLRPRLFCNPTEKLHADVLTPIENLPLHLLCYTMETPDIAAEARVSNQFEDDLFALDRPDLLCVPTAKLRVSLVN